MADKEKLTKKKAGKKITNKTSKKAAKKISKKVAKKVSTRKVARKPVRKKVTKKASKQAIAKKATRKVKKKTTKKASSKIDSRIQELQDSLNGINTEKAEALAKNIWLAGLGAYAKTFDELSERVDDLQDKYSAINSEGQKIFQDLVKRGDSMQGDLEKTVMKGRDTLEDRVEDFKQRFGGSLSSAVDIPSRLRQAVKKVDKLSKKLKKK